MFRWLVVFCIFVSTGMLKADERPRAILVLDASGSMWGQIDGLAKISIAQEVIGELVQGLPPEQILGLTAYGHRRKGDCGDIETLIQPEGDQRIAILDAVRGIKPKGKTPLSAAVIQAAEALRYTEEAATVILVSDGRETCDYDPCAVGRQLEESGIDFTAHVIGFDVANLSDRIQLQCLAEETGGTFRTASDASELADALLIVSKPPAPPQPMAIKYQAITSEDGNAITDPLVWDVYDANGTAIVGSNVTYGDSVTVLPGEYRIEVLRPEDEAYASKVVQITNASQTVTLSLPLIQKLATVMAPDTAVAGTKVLVDWTGPNEPDDFISVNVIDAGEGTWDEYTYTSEGSPLELLMPATEGTYEIRYVLNKGRKDLATRRITVTPVAATIMPPAEMAAGETVPIVWTGPNYPQDFIAVAKPGEDAWINYAYTSEGSPAALQMPTEPGVYDIIYTMEQDRTVIHRVPITVTDIGFSMSAPETAVAGSTVSVNWTGPNYDRDFLALSEVGSRDGAYLTYTYTREGTPLGLRMPLTPGTYEIRYILDQDRVAAARRLITLTEVSGGVSGPTEAVFGSDVKVNWTGPNYDRDYVTVARIEDAPSKYVNFAYTKDGDPATVRMPSEPGLYELRYIADGNDDVVLARQPIMIKSVPVTLTAPARVSADQPFQVAWEGPGNARDYITISKTEDASGYLKYQYAKNGSPVTLNAPKDPGTYELRYFLDQDKKIIGRQSIIVE